MSLANIKLNPIGEALPEKLPDGRIRIVRRWEVVSDLYSPAQVEAQCFDAWGTADGAGYSTPGGVPTKAFSQCRLIDQRLSGDKGVRQGAAVLTKIYEELHATAETQVGGDEITVDDNGRRILTRRFLQFASAPFSAGTIGSSSTIGGVVYALDSVSAPDDGTVRRVVRRYVEATSTLTQVGRDSITTDANNRHRMERIYVQLASAGYVQGTVGGTATSGALNFALDDESKVESEAVRRVVRRYVEATSTLTQVGVDEIVRGNDGRENRRAIFIQLRSGSTYTPPAPGDAYGSTDCVFDSETEGGDVAVRRVVREYIQATTTPQQIGDVRASLADESGAYVGTTGAGAMQTSTKWAREWTVQYVVKGDVTNTDGQWENVSTSRTFGIRTGYLTATEIVRRGTGYCVFSRRYTELPDKYVYHKRTSYTFPGKLGYSSSLGPYVAEPSVTRETTLEIEEDYQVGEISAQSIEFEALWWAYGVVSYTRASGEQGAKAYNFPGCIGTVTISMTNKIFAGYLCSTVSGTVASNPSTYPSGKKRISSRPMPWKGDIWKRVNTYVTFP